MAARLLDTSASLSTQIQCAKPDPDLQWPASSPIAYCIANPSQTRYPLPMTDDPNPPGMIGLPPSARGGRPADIAAHASQIAQEWEDVGETYVRRRNRELGIPQHMNGQPDYGGDGRWRAFNPRGMTGGSNTTGVVVDSGILNPDLLKGQKGGRIWRDLSVQDRADGIISHEYEELLAAGDHVKALKAAAKTKLPISDGARRLNRARAR
jgi:hypothetical protein